MVNVKKKTKTDNKFLIEHEIALFIIEILSSLLPYAQKMYENVRPYIAEPKNTALKTTRATSPKTKVAGFIESTVKMPATMANNNE